MRRTEDFEVTLTLNRPDFVRTPRESQRNWLLNQALAELCADLEHLDAIAPRFVPGREGTAVEDRAHRPLADDEIMEPWQVPLMQAMADVAARSGGDVLEIGFGLGVSAGLIQEHGVRSHTIVECNGSVIERFERWRAGYPGRDIRLVEGRWEDVLDRLGSYDGIFFHAFPLSTEEYIAQVLQSATYAEHFFPAASSLLRPGGVFTYLSNEIDSLSRRHQRALLAHFSTFAVRVVRGLPVPDDVRDTWWVDSMVVVEAVR